MNVCLIHYVIDRINEIILESIYYGVWHIANSLKCYLILFQAYKVLKEIMQSLPTIFKVSYCISFLTAHDVL